MSELNTYQNMKKKKKKYGLQLKGRTEGRTEGN